MEIRKFRFSIASFCDRGIKNTTKYGQSFLYMIKEKLTNVNIKPNKRALCLFSNQNYKKEEFMIDTIQDLYFQYLILGIE